MRRKGENCNFSNVGCHLSEIDKMFNVLTSPNNFNGKHFCVYADVKSAMHLTRCRIFSSVPLKVVVHVNYVRSLLLLTDGGT